MKHFTLSWNQKKTYLQTKKLNTECKKEKKMPVHKKLTQTQSPTERERETKQKNWEINKEKFSTRKI